MRKASSALLVVALVSIGAASQEKFAGYIDQAPPEHTPRVFRLQTHEGYFAGDRIAISADGKELYYTEVTNTWSDYNIRYYKEASGEAICSSVSEKAAVPGRIRRTSARRSIHRGLNSGRM